MSQVNLRIGGRSYHVACADGEEAHLTRLASTVDEKVRQMQDSRTLQEAQSLLFAALLLADELHDARTESDEDPVDLRQRMKSLENEAAAARRKASELALELDALRAERDAIANDLSRSRLVDSPRDPLVSEENLAPRLEHLAQLIEKCADALEEKRPTS